MTHEEKLALAKKLRENAADGNETIEDFNNRLKTIRERILPPPIGN